MANAEQVAVELSREGNGDSSGEFPLATLDYGRNNFQQKKRSIIKRFAIIISGTIVVLFGVALIFLPGPAFVVIPAGLAILGTEVLWARRLLNKIKEKAGLQKKDEDTSQMS